MTRLIPRYAIIPTRNRPEVFFQAYEAISIQVDEVIVINNGDPFEDDERLKGAIVYNTDEQPPNLSRFWNVGLMLAALGAKPAAKWDVAIINDDCIVPEGWFDAISGTMRQMNVAAGCSGGRDHPILHTQPGPVPLHTRMQGFAFILAGEKGARANEQIKWYFTDDHLDWMSRTLGGMVMVPGFPVNHMFPNGQMTPELQEQTARDAEAFTAYWNGLRPW